MLLLLLAWHKPPNLIPFDQSLKPVTFACPSEQEFAEWKQAFQV